MTSPLLSQVRAKAGNTRLVAGKGDQHSCLLRAMSTVDFGMVAALPVRSFAQQTRRQLLSSATPKLPNVVLRSNAGLIQKRLAIPSTEPLAEC